MRELVTILMKRFAQMRDRIRGWVLGRTLHYLAMVDEPWYTWVNALANFYILMRNPERVTHPGNLHPDKTFYVIRDLSPDVGVAGWYDRVLGYILHAERKGWIPIVDPSPPAQPDDGDWYAFFKAPTDIPLVEALQGRNVVISTVQGMIHKRFSRKNVARRHVICQRVPLSDDAQTYVDSHLQNLFAATPSPIVAIRFRGTDYRSHGDYCPIGHAKVPDVDVFCDRVIADMEEWGIPVGKGEHIFLVTEEQEAFESILRRFPRCRYVAKERYANFNFKSYLTRQRLPTLTPKENNMMYLLEIYAMARCDYLIGGVNGGVLMALNLNGNRYKGVDIVKTGVN